jgi:hypothetical protein
MANVTLAFDETTLALGREKARQSGTSFNAYVRQLVTQDVQIRKSWLHDVFACMDQHPLDSKSVTWTREELHERQR